MALIKQLPEGADARELQKIAKQIATAVTQELGIKVVIGIGTVVNHIRDLARAYKEAGVAIDVGKVFENEKTIINYENLGIGRLIYQLPTILCQMFLQEVFKKNPIDALDQETLLTINKFFENNLNVSETAGSSLSTEIPWCIGWKRLRSLPDWTCGNSTTLSPSRWP